VAAGPGRRNKKGRLRPLDVKAGDDVLFAQYSGTKIQVGSSEFLILREEDVLGIVT
jgi:chaperonin GroES